LLSTCMFPVHLYFFFFYCYESLMIDHLMWIIVTRSARRDPTRYCMTVCVWTSASPNPYNENTQDSVKMINVAGIILPNRVLLRYSLLALVAKSVV
jgi:hypothetical protein